METLTLNMMNKNIEYIMKEITKIKEYMVDLDGVLTYDDMESLHEAEKDLLEGKTKRLA